MAAQPSLKWSASFAVAHPSAYASKDLKGDKIILPQSALEQLLAASSSSVTSLPSTFTSYDPFNPYTANPGRPQHAFYADSHQKLPNPLMFRLVNQANGNVVNAGIREFSAEEGEVALSPYLMDALGVDEKSIPDTATRDGSPEEPETSASDTSPAPQITVHAEQLPKGTYVRLRPLEAGYNPDDWKALLERQLRESFTTLTKEALLSVRGVRGETFRFLVDKFEPEGNGICVVDTDLEVDIEALNEEQARETLKQIMTNAQRAPGSAGGSSVGHEINIWKPVEGQVVPGDYVDYELPSWNKSRPLEIELSGLEDDYAVDLFVSPRSTRQRAPPRATEHIFSAYQLSSDGNKTVVIQSTNVEMEGAESILISVHGYLAPHESSSGQPVPFKLRARARMDNSSALTPTQADTPHDKPPEEGADVERCKNCRQWIPKRTMMLHENFCARNNVSCPDCGGVFQKKSEEWQNHWHCPYDEGHGSSEASKVKHDDIYHTELQCPICPFSTNAEPDLARHRTSLCPGKIILCQFCHLEVPQEGDPFAPSPETLLSGLTAHEVADGARTTDCHLCGAIVRLRDTATHLRHHELDKAQRPRPRLCRNANCGRTLHGVGRHGALGAGTNSGQGPGNDLGLCSLCYAPLYVQLHDPEGKALRRRVERRYLAQMMTGCGKAWCRNAWCKRGRANTGLEPQGGGAAALLPRLKPLLDTATAPGAEKAMYFCVDERSQRQRALAEALAAEGAWDVEWCVAACEAEGANLDRAREWLGNWAPTRS